MADEPEQGALESVGEVLLHQAEGFGPADFRGDDHGPAHAGSFDFLDSVDLARCAAALGPQIENHRVKLFAVLHDAGHAVAAVDWIFNLQPLQQVLKMADRRFVSQNQDLAMQRVQ